MPQNWYELSIAAIMNEIFKSEGLKIEFDNSKFFSEEVRRWQVGKSPAERKKILSIAKQARKIAFNKKYGNYDYSMDVRSRFLDWGQKLFALIHPNLKEEGNNIISVGSNNGSELTEIFLNYQKQHIDIIEISKTAVEIGQKLFPSFNFHCASMDEVQLPPESYDIYLNLRAAYCAGNNLDTIMKCAYSTLKKSGVSAISVSNGYITCDTKQTIQGVYNPNTLECSLEETNKNLNWVYQAMKNANFKNIAKYDIGSEIVLLGYKQKQR